MKLGFDVGGSSLVELLVSLLILGVLAAGLHQSYAALLRNVAVLKSVSEAQERVQIGIELMQRDLRSAGFSPDGSFGHGVRFAQVDRIGIARDLNGDHDSTDANERVAYYFDHDGSRLMRQMGNAPPQPMLNDLAQEGLTFEYFTADGYVLDPANGSLSDEERSRLRRIDLALSIELPHPYHGDASPIRCRQRSTVTLRNAN